MRIVFILNSYGKSRYDKRIEEFIHAGYKIEVYAFKRFEGDLIKSSFPVEIIGKFDNSLSYLKRTQQIYSSLKKILSRYRDQDVLYYIFGLDVAMVFGFLRHRQPYIYEEGDLVHTYIKNALIRNTLEIIDKKTIRKSQLTVFTSEGFSDYHFGRQIENSIIIPNKIGRRILDLPTVDKDHLLDINHLNIGFVGAPRFKKVRDFFKIACNSFPQHSFHIFGGPVPLVFEELRSYSNMFFHGLFKTPDDLPEIYSNLDLVLSTYDTDSDNVRYAEPNKLYEAIYFDTPIIVSSGTFLCEKVKRLGVGFEIDVNEKNVNLFLKSITFEEIEQIKCRIREIPRSFAINDSTELFDRINHVLGELDFTK